MKKMIAILAALAVTTTMSACGSNPPADPSADTHTHTVSGKWLADPAEHWQLCDECGEKAQAGAHTIDEAWRCTVCNSDIFEWDESTDVHTYDEYENIVRVAEYDLDGNVISEQVNENEYDDNGCVLYSKEYTNGNLVTETEYKVVDGESESVKYTYYSEDGTWFTNEYDDYGNVTVMVDYDAEGNMSMQTDSQYVENSNGDWYEAARTEVYADGTRIEMMLDEQGSIISNISYDADGTVTSNESWEFTYDEETGFTATEKAYADGVLLKEVIYKIVVEDDFSMGYPETVTTYNDDGSYTVCVYDESDEVLSETNYDAAGNVVE